MKQISNFLNLLISMAKAREIILLIIVGALSSIIALREKLFSSVDFQIPIIVLITFCSLAAYPILKLIEWLFGLRKTQRSIIANGLLWNPSRFWFGNPTPLCPICRSPVLILEKRNPIVLMRSRQDYDNVNDKLVEFTYECPSHGVLAVPNRSLEVLQALARTLIRNQKKKITSS